MKKKPDIEPNDIAVFEDAIKGTKRIHSNKIDLAKPTPQPPRPRPSRDQAFHIELNETSNLPAINAETIISYHQEGIPHKTLRNLRKGQYNVEAILDLHGMTTAEAKVAVNKFLQACLGDGMRVVLIIHGKGRSQQPVLKNKLNDWLRGVPAVLAFCSASTAHGSRGALYVLLKALHKIRGEET